MKPSSTFETVDVTARNHFKLLKWTLPLFVLAMTLNISSAFIIAYVESDAIGHQMVSALDNEEEFHNVIWDDFCYIPRINAAASGNLFSDPWNSYNPNHKGWGAFGLLPPLIGGAFIYLFGNYFLAMSAWGLINFSLITILIYYIFRLDPFGFSKVASILGAFLVLNLLWIASQPFDWFYEVIPKTFLTGWHFSLVQLESGLLTYLPYILFLAFYWSFVTGPNWCKSTLLGGAAGLLTYVYFYHFIFAFALILGHIGVSLSRKNKQATKLLAGALAIGLIISVPFLVNSIIFVKNTASLFYQQRMDYSPGRLPFKDYHWFLRLLLPLLIGIAYIRLRENAEVKWIMIRSWVALGIAYAIVLHVRVVLGFMQAVDHFWRLSLGIPASLWCILAVFDLVQSRYSRATTGKKVLYIAVNILPLLILARFAGGILYSVQKPDVINQLSSNQIEMVAKIDCLDQVIKPREGLLTDDPALNYHAMANLRILPFMAMGASTISVEELSNRYLLSAYLTGQDNIQYPELVNRKADTYTYERDVHLYLYVNLFVYPWSDTALENRLRLKYQNWDPANVEWSIWENALSTVKAVYLDTENIDQALPRLKRRFIIQKAVSCESGKTFGVIYKKAQE
jgi:hypothetical protein